MGRYAVDPVVLGHVDAQVEATVAHARAALGALGVDMHALLCDGWRSPAAAAFAGGWHDWHAAAVELLAALEQMGQAIALSAHGYASTEEGVRSSMVTP
jgi:WXG100 family type VII secretion target